MPYGQAVQAAAAEASEKKVPAAQHNPEPEAVQRVADGVLHPETAGQLAGMKEVREFAVVAWKL